MDTCVDLTDVSNPAIYDYDKKQMDRVLVYGWVQMLSMIWLKYELSTNTTGIRT